MPVEALVSALQGVQDALQLMVEHLADYRRKPGKPPKWIKDQSSLQLAATQPGSLVAELTLDTTAVGLDGSETYGEQAFAAFQRWEGRYDSTLPYEAGGEQAFEDTGQAPSRVPALAG